MITKCVCFNKTFADILKESKEENITSLLSFLKEKKICNKCRMCHPYLKETFRNGIVEFPLDFIEEDDRLKKRKQKFYEKNKNEDG